MKRFASFAEAIREGAKLKPGIQGYAFAADATCSIGAGVDAMGMLGEMPIQVDVSVNAYNVLRAEYPYLFTVSKRVCHEAGDGVCDEPVSTLYSQIIHLNDEHKWTRERVADW